MCARYTQILLLLFSHPIVFDSVTLWTVARQASLSLIISQSLPKFMSIDSVMPSKHLMLCYPIDNSYSRDG